MIRILAVTHPRTQPWAALQEEYIKRCSPFLRIECIALKPDRSSLLSTRLQRESRLLFSKLDPQAYAVLLDGAGKAYSTEEFSQRLQRWVESSMKVTFLIGGAHGVSEELRNRMQDRMSMSEMTMPHDFARIFLLEQIYRSISIWKNMPYHH